MQSGFLLLTMARGGWNLNIKTKYMMYAKNCYYRENSDIARAKT